FLFFVVVLPRPPRSTLFPYTTLFRSMGAAPRFDSYGRLCGAELVALENLGRPRVDVLTTLSGIFRDLLPLQTRMLAEAAFLAARSEEHTSELQSRRDLVCRLLLEKKK